MSPELIVDVDLSRAFAEDDGAAEGLDSLTVCGRQIVAAMREVGACTVSGLPISAGLQQKLFEQARVFFQLQQHEKDECSMARGGRAWRGYFGPGSELTAGRPDLKEGFYFGAEHPPKHPLVLRREAMHGQNIWPQVAGFSETVLRYTAACEAACRLILRAIATGMNLPQERFAHFLLPEPTCLFRMFRYPEEFQTDVQGADWGVGEHTDMGFLTLLLQDPGETALEVRTRSGNWLMVPPEPGRFVLNIGDMFEYCTRGYLWATPHRVRKSKLSDGRLSFPFFFDPAWDSHVPRLTPSELQRAGWRQVEHEARSKHARWDQLNLHDLESELTYGQFVWSKIRNVFPWLAAVVD